jgi:hypothetical protein
MKIEIPEIVATQLSADHARGGVTGHNVRYVLAASIAAAVAGLMLVAAIA